MKSLNWVAGAAVALALLGCGGEDTDAGGPSTGPAVQVSEVPAGLKVTAALPAPLVRDVTQYAFSARITSGPHAGRALSGTLMLQGDGDGDAGSGTQVEGSLVGTARIAADPALMGQFNTTAQSLRATLRTGIEAASARLRDAMTAGTGGATLTATQSQALQQFKQSIAILHLQYRSDVSTLNAQLLAGIAAVPDEDLQVSGSIDAQGQVDLRVALPDQSVLRVTGRTAANGSLAGDLAGEGSTDLGTWSATPQAMPAPAPTGSVAAGQARYMALCASCHTDNVRRNVFNVAAANDVARLDAALAGIGSMNFLRAGMSAQDKLDVVAYILSAR